MIFKQDILKEEKLKFGIGMLAVTIHIALMIVLGFLYRSEWIPIVVLTLIFLPIYLLMLLIGFDNLEYASLPKVKLTTFSQSTDALAKAAVRLLLELIESGDRLEYTRKLVLPTLVERNTCQEAIV